MKKKYYLPVPGLYKIWKSKLFVLMRTVIFFIVISIAQTFAVNSYSQVTKLSLSENNQTIMKILEKIEDQSEFYFMFDATVVDLNQKVSINCESRSVRDILEQIFKSTEVTFKIDDRQIALSNVNMIQSSQQQTSISGKVTDQSGSPLPGVTVIVKGTTQGTVTDAAGNYSLSTIPSNATLVFSFIGMRTQEIQVSGKTTINVTMAEEAIGIEEVVAVGYGTMKKVNLTGAVGVATSEALENRAVTNVGQGLLGVIPGLNVSSPSGAPDEATDFNVRGFESINGGAPLILVDGIPMDPDRLNPTDIESVSVLKDASSAAIYGARAAFGVILITTKKGKKGKTHVTFSSQTTLKNMLFPGYEPINDGGTARDVMNQARQVTFGRILYPQYVVDAAYAYQEMSNPSEEDKWYRDGTKLWYLGTDRPKELGMQDFAPQQNYNFSISGASEKASYYVSLGMVDTKGFFKYNNEDYKRYNALFKLDFKVYDWLTLESKMGFTSIKNDDPHPYDSSFYYNSIGRNWFSVPQYFPDLEYYIEPGDRAKFEPYIGMLGRYNLAAYLKYGGRDVTRSNEMLFSQGVTITPLPGLKIHGDFSHTSYWSEVKKAHSEIVMSNNDSYGGIVLTSALTTKGNTANDWLDVRYGQDRFYAVNVFGEYTVQNIGNHNLKALVGFNQEHRFGHAVSTRSTELITPYTPSLGATTGTTSNSESGGEFMLRGVFYRLTYTYKDKYLFEANGRYDGTSRFPHDDRFGFFPSFSAGWRLSEEPFMDATNGWLDNLKIRGSYGELGNQGINSKGSPVYYPYISSMSPGESDMVLDNSATKIRIITPGGLVSNTLTWETVIHKNIGIDITILDKKLNVSFDYYTRDTKDMLMTKNYPGILGTAAPQENAADLRTKGWDASASWASRIGKDWSYRANLTFSDYQTEITKYDSPSEAINGYYVGKKIGEIWGYKTIGLFQTEEELTNAADQSRLGRNWRLGDVHYADLDGDGVITSGNNIVGDTGDRIRIGNSEPRYNFGLSQSIKYKNFTLDIFAQGVLKRDFMPTSGNSVRFFPFKYVGMEQWWIDDSWSPENPDAYFPGIQFAYSDGKNATAQTRWIQNAAYIRIKSMTLSYNIPTKLFAKAQVYLSGENLWEIHGMYKTLSPWFNPNLNPGYFFNRSFTFGINVTL